MKLAKGLLLGTVAGFAVVGAAQAAVPAHRRRERKRHGCPEGAAGPAPLLLADFVILVLLCLWQNRPDQRAGRLVVPECSSFQFNFGSPFKGGNESGTKRARIADSDAIRLRSRRYIVIIFDIATRSGAATAFEDRKSTEFIKGVADSDRPKSQAGSRARTR